MKNRSRASSLLLVLLPLWLGLAASMALADDFYRFGLFGDTPYSEEERAHLPRMLESMARDDIAFAIHDGDIKDGISRCSDEMYQDRLTLFQSARFPVIYVPGDNEWTDCHGLLNSLYTPEERLRHLRNVFFFDGQTLGQKKFALERQGDMDREFFLYRENVRWTRGKVMFITLNMPGSNNNWGPGDRPSAEFLERGKANRKWLADSFAKAQSRRDATVFVVIQANPDFESYNNGRRNLPYSDFLQQLTDLTLAFPGQVVLVHGDTHNQHMDRPMRDPRSRKPVRKFARVETFGSPYMGWTEITVWNPETAPRLTIRINPYRY